jgi:hypothetical protein
MDISLLFSLLSGIFILLAYGTYNRDIFLGVSKPNAVSWGLWTIITLLNTASYFIMTGDVFKNLLSFSASIACFITFIFVIREKNYSALLMVDYSTLSIGVIAVFSWWWFRSVVSANLILQLANIIAFIPTYRSVWNNPKNEKPLPWFLFGIAYLFLNITVFLRWNNNHTDLVFPVIALILHASLAVLIIFRSRTKHTAKTNFT